jgi:hypothetical protein
VKLTGEGKEEEENEPAQRYMGSVYFGFGSSPIFPLMLSFKFFIQWLVYHKKQKKI